MKNNVQATLGIVFYYYLFRIRNTNNDRDKLMYRRYY